MWKRLAQWHNTTLGHGLAGGVLLWAAQPPLDLGPLAFIGPVWWLRLARRRELPGRRPYGALWLAGVAFWLAAYYWLTLPHWATGFGWLAVAVYMGCYLPAQIALVRAAVHRFRVPLIVAAPVVWTGLEYIRAYLLTGITMGSLAHTQHRWLALIQLSDLAGFYGVGFVVMLVAACLTQVLPGDDRPWSWRPAVSAALVLAAALTYGHLRLGPPEADATLRVALIQGSIDTKFGDDEMTPERTYEHYLALSRQAVAAHGPVDLVVWPETMFRFPLIEADADAAKPDWYPKSAAEFRAEAARWTALGRQAVAQLARELDAALLLGIDVQRFTAAGQQWRNSAVYVGRDGAIRGRYDKMHLVIFGEYVPLAGWFPWLQKLTPLPFSIEAGGAPAVFSHQGVRLSPNICYENVLPQVIRRQVNAGIARGEGPDVLVNLTNDGWFWGSSELDMHLACGVFRAVECRKPLLIAANTGFSAWIDGDGRVRARGPRRQSATILATAAADGRTSWYLRHGDWFAATCLALTLAVGVAALVQRVRSGKGRTFGFAK